MFIYRLNGFANPYSFMTMEDNDLSPVEEFVKNELESLILDRCKRLNTEFDDKEKEFFFGVYAGNIGNFKFLRGEQIQIAGLRRILRTMHSANGKEDFSKRFETPENFQLGGNAISEFSFGRFYGQPHKPKNKQSIRGMESTLFEKTKKFFESYDLKKNQEITKEMVQVIDLGSSMRGDVSCIFCPFNEKTYSIQYDKAGKWNFSNFKKHVQIHLSKEKAKTESLPAENSKQLQTTPASIEGQLKSLETESDNAANQSDVIKDCPIVLEEYGIFYNDNDNDNVASANTATIKKKKLK